jgi:hypothetical protein
MALPVQTVGANRRSGSFVAAPDSLRKRNKVTPQVSRGEALCGRID